MTDPKKPAFYLRVSTLDQDFPSQVHALEEFMRRWSWPVPAKKLVFAEKVSGSKAKRTQLDRLLESCRKGQVDTILCYRADRMGNTALNMHRLFEELDRLKIRVIGVADGIDTGTQTAATNLFRNMLIAFSQGQREVTSERTVAGLKAARRAGRIGGKPRTSDRQIAQALALRGKPGLSLRQIAARVKLSPTYLSFLFRGMRPKK
jgi:DNA invertase Pin-like site-specific DNA recombinase